MGYLKKSIKWSGYLLVLLLSAGFYGSFGWNAMPAILVCVLFFEGAKPAAQMGVLAGLLGTVRGETEAFLAIYYFLTLSLPGGFAAARLRRAILPAAGVALVLSAGAVCWRAGVLWCFGHRAVLAALPQEMLRQGIAALAGMALCWPIGAAWHRPRKVRVRL